MRSLYLADPAVEAALGQAVGEGPFRLLVDLGTGSGRMLALFGPKAGASVGLEASGEVVGVKEDGEVAFALVVGLVVVAQLLR